MGRKANLYNKAKLGWAAVIIDNAVKFYAKVRGAEVTTRDTLRCDALLKALIATSDANFNTKSSISDKLLNAVLERNEEFVNKVAVEFTYLSGYKYDDLANMVYYLVWFACTEDEPEYKTLDEFAASLSDDKVIEINEVVTV